MKTLLEVLQEAEAESLVKLTVDTYESDSYPVVTHVFTGKDHLIEDPHYYEKLSKLEL